MDTHQKTIVIEKDQAVFWMDGQGNWHNRHGRFEHAGIIRHFNRSIQHDEMGFFVSQVRDDILEKVYFHHAETAIFAVDILVADTTALVLNTNHHIRLVPEQVLIFNDSLFQREARYFVKFSERALSKISRYLSMDGDGYQLEIGGVCASIPVVSQLSHDRLQGQPPE